MKYPDVTAGQVEAAINIIGGWERFLQLLRGELVVKAVDLLKRVTTILVAGATKFVAKDAFGPNNPDGIRFFLWGGFKKHFSTLVEENVEPTEIAVQRLEKSSRDPEIMTELGAEKRVIKLTHFYNLIKAQAKGQEGTLLVNGYANIAYIEDENRTLWAVTARWSSSYREWDVRASSVGHPAEWDAGDQVLSQV